MDNYFRAGVFGIAILACGQAVAQSLEKNEEVSVIAVSGFIEHNNGGNVEVKFDLGELPPGKKGVIRLTLRNPFEDDFIFKSIEAGCSCLKIRAPENIIPALGSLDIEAELSTPSRIKDLNQQIGFFLKAGDGFGINVRISYLLAGALSFPEKLHVTSSVLGAKTHDFVIPILISPPIQATDLKIHGLQGLKDVEARVVKNDGNFGIECRLSLLGGMEDGRTGEIVVHDTKSGREASIRCLIEAPSQILVAPSVVRFRPEPIIAGEKVQKFSSSVLIRIHPSVLTEGEVPLMEFSSTKDKLKTDVEKLALGIYRVNIELIVALEDNNAVDLETDEPYLKWSIATKKNRREGKLSMLK